MSRGRRGDRMWWSRSSCSTSTPTTSHLRSQRPGSVLSRLKNLVLDENHSDLWHVWGLCRGFKGFALSFHDVCLVLEWGTVKDFKHLAPGRKGWSVRKKKQTKKTRVEKPTQRKTNKQRTWCEGGSVEGGKGKKDLGQVLSEMWCCENLSSSNLL